MRLAMERLNQQRRPQRGDPCQCDNCRGVLHVGNTRPKPAQGVRVQYLECSVCHVRPIDNKIIIPLQFAPEIKRNS